MTTYNADTAFATLKDFQVDTVEHVLRRLYDDPDHTDRFLVADEVGMGKTLVARGVIAGAIERLQHDAAVPRIDIIYICSNADIAGRTSPSSMSAATALSRFRRGSRCWQRNCATSIARCPTAARRSTSSHSRRARRSKRGIAVVASRNARCSRRLLGPIVTDGRAESQRAAAHPAHGCQRATMGLDLRRPRRT